MQRIISFLKLLGTPNYYRGIDKPTLLQWLYQWRIGVNTAWKVSGIIWNRKN
jgi:hypothetical protein